MVHTAVGVSCGMETLQGVQDPKLVYNRKSNILNRNLHINDFQFQIIERLQKEKTFKMLENLQNSFAGK